jgi:hypothetical protein
MTTTEHFDRQRHVAVTADDRNERAQRAVRAFRAMQFGLTSYARAITGNKRITVEIASGPPRTDGIKIYYQPPIALGDKRPHVRRDCDIRDETGLQTCPACAVREEVLVNIYHEIGHIAGGTFAEVPDHVKKNATQKAIEEWGGKYAEQIKRRFEAAPGRITGTYKGLAGLISPFLPYLVNCIEDARVDSAMFKARQGIRTMMQASTISIFTEGMEQHDGSLTSWSDAPLNAQASIACYLAACGYDGWEAWLHESVAEAFTDPKLKALLVGVADMDTAQQTYEVSFPVLARLRELGFYQMPEDKEEEKEDEPDEADSDPGEESSDEGDPSEAGEDSGQDSGDASEEEEGPAGEGEEVSPAGSGGDDEGESESPQSDGDGDQPESSSEDGESGEASGTPQDEEEAGNAESPEGGEIDDGTAYSDKQSDDEADSGAGSGGGDTPEDEPADPTDQDSTGGGDPQDESGDNSDGDSESSGTGSSVQTSSDPDDGDQDGSQDSEAVTGENESSDDGDEPNDDSEGSDLVDDDEAEELDERIDTGADEGQGGVEVENVPEAGKPEDLEGILEHFHRDDVQVNDSPEDDAAVQIAVVQGLYFEKPSENVIGVREHSYDHPMENKSGVRMDQAWAHTRLLGVYGSKRYELGIEVELDVTEEVMGPALLQTRRVFTDNATAKHQRHLRSGRVNKAVLGRRAWNDDDRLFTKKRLPGKRSYAVLIGIDVSGSTIGENLALAKRAAWAQAELCSRAGIDFAVYAHSANRRNGEWGSTGGLYLDIYEIKNFNEPWDTNRQNRLSELGSDSENLDGHTMEYYRKRLDEVQATDKILLYYTDGKMPAANHAEELEILQREIKTCAAKGYTLLGVGIRTDSPRRHGLDTVQVNDDRDLKSVVMHLEKRLVRAGSGR